MRRCFTQYFYISRSLKMKIRRKSFFSLTFGLFVVFINVAYLHAQDQDSGLSEDARSGHTIFKANCAPCHQDDGAGKIGLAPSIRNRDFLAIASDEFIKMTIKQGRPGTSMIPRADLTDKDLNNIIAWLRSLEVKNPLKIIVDPTKTVKGDMVKGKENYHLYCSSCHGQNGEGYSSGGSGPGIGLKGFLSVASDDYIFQTVKIGRIGTAMRSFSQAEGLAHLADQDIKDVIVYLRNKDAEHHEESEQVSSTGDATKGKEIFKVNCGVCHGENAEGKPSIAPGIGNKDFLAIADDDYIKATIQNGREGTAMMARKDLSDQQIKDITSYLRSLAPNNKAIVIDKTKVFTGDKEKGGTLFATNCSACHKADAKGYVSGGIAPAIGLKGFLNSTSDEFILHTIKSGRAGTAMLAFGNGKGPVDLTDEEIKNIIVYLRSLNK